MPETAQPVMLCRHIFTDGHRCGSPALRHEHFCYYHHKTRRPGPRQPQVKSLADRKLSTFDLPTPADLGERAGVQHAIGLILHKIAHNELDPRRAGLLLYGLQIASGNLPRESRPEPVTHVVPKDLVAELTRDPAAPELGELAPAIQYEDGRPRNAIEQILDHMHSLDLSVYDQPPRLAAAPPHDATTAQPSPTSTRDGSSIDLDAAAAPSRSCRSTRNSRRSRTLLKKSRGPLHPVLTSPNPHPHAATPPGPGRGPRL